MWTECLHPLKLHMLKSWPIIVMVFGGGTFGKELGHEGGVLMHGISVLIRRNTREMIFLSGMWGYSEKTAIHKSGSMSPPDTRSAGTLILDCPAFRTVRNKCLLFKALSLWYLVIRSWTKTVTAIQPGRKQAQELLLSSWFRSHAFF